MQNFTLKYILIYHVRYYIKEFIANLHISNIKYQTWLMRVYFNVNFAPHIFLVISISIFASVNRVKTLIASTFSGFFSLVIGFPKLRVKIPRKSYFAKHFQPFSISDLVWLDHISEIFFREILIFWKKILNILPKFALKVYAQNKYNIKSANEDTVLIRYLQSIAITCSYVTLSPKDDVCAKKCLIY